MFVIAGASGRTGRVVAETLLSRGTEVRLLLRDPQKGESWRQRGAEVALLSLDEEAALARALRGSAGLYVLLPEDPGARDFHRERRATADSIASAVKSSGIPHVVLLSASAAALSDGNGPAQDLHYLEQALGRTESRRTVIRAVYFQENVLAALPAARHEKIYPNFLPSASATLPTVATRDVGMLAAQCLLDPPTRSEVIDLVGPAYSVHELSSKLGMALGEDLRVVDIPAAMHVDVLTKAGLSRSFAEAIAEMYACFASGRVAAEGDRVFSGTTTLDDILPELVERAGHFRTG